MRTALADLAAEEAGDDRAEQRGQHDHQQMGCRDCHVLSNTHFVSRFLVPSVQGISKFTYANLSSTTAIHGETLFAPGYPARPSMAGRSAR